MSPTTPQAPSSLRSKIQHFIELNSQTTAYQQRSHSHHSLTNAYIVATFLEEANTPVPSLKRDAGLRDLAQRLLLWPGDVTVELQRDALTAIELLDGYVKDSLEAEMKFVEDLEGKEDRQVTTKGGANDIQHAGTESLSDVRDAAIKDLQLLKLQLKSRITTDDDGFPATGFELHDLTPFIPGFTSSRSKAPISPTHTDGPAVHNLPAQKKHAGK